MVDDTPVVLCAVARGGTDPQVGAHFRVGASGVVLIHGANGGHTVVVGEFIKVGVVSIQMSIASGKSRN